MMPALAGRAHEWGGFSPMKENVSPTFAGSTCHVSRGGSARALPPGSAPPPRAGGGGMHNRVNVPCQSVPAAAFAEEMSVSIEVGDCADRHTEARMADV